MHADAQRRDLPGADAFVAALWDAGTGATRRHTIALAGHRIDLAFSPGLEPLLLPALAHLTTEPRGAAALQIRLWDSDSTAVPLPTPPWDRSAYPDGGEIRGPDTDAISIAYRFDPGALSVLDRDTGRAVFWVASPATVPGWMQAAPLRTILPWFIAATGGQFVHGAGVGIDGHGVLIAGAGGSGKSTTAVLCADAGLQFAGDDYVVIGADGDVHAAYNSAKLDDASLALLPHLAPWVINDDPDVSKHVVLLHDALPGRVVPRLRLDAIVLPHVGDGPSRLRPASPAEALLALAPTTVFQLPGAGRPALRFMADLARRVPAFHLELGTPDTVAATVTGLLHAGAPS
ncbi:MAG: hypothetical protein PVI35_06425 [Acidimicrobiia bacterium]|jgi:hypothetical protein